MVISNVALKNFKCFKEVNVKLSKITLLTGANSSGKSSFLYSILAMLQSENFPFYLSPNGEFIDLGSFEEISFKNNHKQSVEIVVDLNESFSYHYKGPIKIKTVWIENPKNKLPQLDELIISSKELQIIISKKEKNYYFSISDNNDTGYVLNKLRAAFLAIKEISKAEKVITSKNIIEIKNASFNSVNAILESTFFNSPFYFFSKYLQFFDDSFKNLKEHFNFIGSFREPPQRTYYQKSKPDSKINISGVGYIDQILDWEETNTDKFKELNALLKQLKLLTQIKSRKMRGGRFELKIRTNKSGILASLTDVGFGVSQFLPIIVSDLQLPDNSLLIMSQPEIHLHPEIQATLGDYVTKQIKNKKRQYIIETHSEYLLNRIRLNIVKGTLSQSDVSVYYLNNTIEGTQVHSITFTKNGTIQGAPSEFFNTYMLDVMNIALKAQ
jgi:predicted ATPase